MALSVSIDIDPRAIAMLRERYSEAELTPARLSMARIPIGAELIDNSVSRAPGFMIGNVIVMAGVPRTMEATLASVTPRLRTGAKLMSISIHADAPEGEIAAYLTAAQQQNPDVKMGSYPYFENGCAGVYLVVRSVDAARLAASASALEERLASAGSPHDRAPGAAGAADPVPRPSPPVRCLRRRRQHNS
jgi:molybdopterin-biosynthesis enzyme MoeA-like protein